LRAGLDQRFIRGLLRRGVRTFQLPDPRREFAAVENILRGRVGRCRWCGQGKQEQCGRGHGLSLSGLRESYPYMPTGCVAHPVSYTAVTTMPKPRPERRGFVVM